MGPSSINSETLLQHGDFVRRLARKLVGDSAEADDVTQDVWARALAARHEVIQDVRAWLGGIVRHVSHQRFRREAGLKKREAQVAQSESPPPFDELIHLEQIGHVVAAIQHLPESHRAVILLRFYENLPPREIANRLGIPVETVKTRLKRSIVRLRSELDQRYGDRDTWQRAMIPLALAKTSFLPSSVAIAIISVSVIVLSSTVIGPLRNPDKVLPRPQNSHSVDVESPSVAMDSSPERVLAPKGQVSADKIPNAASSPTVYHLYDRTTRSPVPHYALSTPQGIFQSDENGQLRMPATQIHLITPVDDPLWTGPALCSIEAQENRLWIDAGPTLALELRTLDGILPTDLEARLSSAETRTYSESAFARVRTDSPAWVRFAPDARFMRSRPPYALEVRSQDGFYFGECVIDSFDEPNPIPIIHLQRCGVVEGRVSDSLGHPLQEVTVVLEPLDIAQEQRLSTTNETGHFRVPWLPSGSYQCEVSTPRHHANILTLSVLEREITQASVELKSLGDLVSVHAIIECDPTVVWTKTFAVLTHREPPLRVYSRELTKPSDNSQEIAVHFDGVPRGPYSLSIHSEDFLPWTPQEQLLLAPSRGARIRRDDSILTDDIWLRSTDDDQPFDVFVSAGALSKVQRAHRGVHHLRALPREVPLSITARAPGHVPLEFSRQDIKDDSITLSFQPGWGNRFILRDREGTSISGVSLSLDGQPSEPSDTDGTLHARGVKPPRSIGIHGDEWRLVGGDLTLSNPDTPNSSESVWFDLIWGVEVILAPTESRGLDR